ncbi:MAG: aspartate/glutamate racemase family protein [Comamonadaceae bacterium]
MSFLGILMLDTRFPRPPGDIGNPVTFEQLQIPVRYQTVRGASPQKVVRGSAALALQPFVTAALNLVEQGATLLSTSCGFLARYQRELQAAVTAPVISSSLLWLSSPELSGERCAVLTIDALALDAHQLEGVDADPATPVGGVAPGCEFQRRLLGNEATMDLRQAEQDVVVAALALVRAHPEVTTLVLECTNMPPYARAVAAATGRRVEHIVSLLEKRWRTAA